MLKQNLRSVNIPWSDEDIISMVSKFGNDNFSKGVCFTARVLDLLLYSNQPEINKDQAQCFLEVIHDFKFNFKDFNDYRLSMKLHIMTQHPTIGNKGRINALNLFEFINDLTVLELMSVIYSVKCYYGDKTKGIENYFNITGEETKNAEIEERSKKRCNVCILPRD